MPTVTANGINIHYEKSGSGEPLILISGYCCDHTLWNDVAPHLANHFEVIAFDNRGAGYTQSPDVPNSIELMAQDTAAFIEALKLPQAYLVGHSMGGAIALRTAFDIPQKLKKIVAANTSVKFSPITLMNFEFFLGLRLDGVKLERMAQGILPWIYSNTFLSNKQNVIDSIKETMENPKPQTYEAQKEQANALIKHDATHWYKQIKVPTLIIGGNEDLIAPLSHSHELQEGIPGSKLHVFEKIGHMPNVEKPREFSQAVIDFLR